MHIALPSERQMRGLVDPDASGTVSLEELQEGLMRLRESHTDLMSLGTQRPGSLMKPMAQAIESTVGRDLPAHLCVFPQGLMWNFW